MRYLECIVAEVRRSAAFLSTHPEKRQGSALGTLRRQRAVDICSTVDIAMHCS